MSFPKIDLPVYTLILPSNGEKIKYRPYTVKEKKILLMANESKQEDLMYNAIKQIVENCIADHNFNVSKLAYFDLFYIFLKLRAKSVGEIASFQMMCEECKKPHEISINIDSIEVKKFPNHSNKIQLTETTGVVMKYPDFSIEKYATNYKGIETDIEIIVNCIESVFDKNEVYDITPENKKDLISFIENLTDNQFSMFTKFFETCPTISHEHVSKCPHCQREEIITLSDITDFFGFAA